MSGGVVFAGNCDSGSGLAKYSPRFTFPAGPLPPGAWYATVAATILVAGGNIVVPANTYVEADGKNVTIPAGAAIAVGDRRKPEWPWSKPWPLNIMDENGNGGP